MKKLFLVLTSLCCLSASAATTMITNGVSFRFIDFMNQPQAVRSITLYPIEASFTNGAGAIVSKDRLVKTTGTNGNVTLSNMYSGSYRLELQGPSTVTTNWFLFPETNGPLNASDWITNSGVQVAFGSAYSQAQSDARYMQGTNTGTDSQVFTWAGAAKRGYWADAPAAGGGGGPHNANQFSATGSKTNIKESAVVTNLVHYYTNGTDVYRYPVWMLDPEGRNGEFDLEITPNLEMRQTRHDEPNFNNGIYHYGKDFLSFQVQSARNPRITFLFNYFNEETWRWNATNFASYQSGDAGYNDLITIGNDEGQNFNFLPAICFGDSVATNTILGSNVVIYVGTYSNAVAYTTSHRGRTNNVASLTFPTRFSAHGLKQGDTIIVTGVGGSSYNGTFVITDLNKGTLTSFSRISYASVAANENTTADTGGSVKGTGAEIFRAYNTKAATFFVPVTNIGNVYFPVQSNTIYLSGGVPGHKINLGYFDADDENFIFLEGNVPSLTAVIKTPLGLAMTNLDTESIVVATAGGRLVNGVVGTGLSYNTSTKTLSATAGGGGNFSTNASTANGTFYADVSAASFTGTGSGAGSLILSNAAGTDYNILLAAPSNQFNSTVTFRAAVTNLNLTASRVMLTDANKAESSATASGTSIIRADGTAVTVGSGLTDNGTTLSATASGGVTSFSWPFSLGSGRNVSASTTAYLCPCGTFSGSTESDALRSIIPIDGTLTNLAMVLCTSSATALGANTNTGVTVMTNGVASNFTGNFISDGSALNFYITNVGLAVLKGTRFSIRITNNAASTTSYSSAGIIQMTVP